MTKEGSVQAFVELSEETRQALLVRAEEGPMIVLGDEGPQFYARCNCGEKHSGRPVELAHGCGRSALIDAPPGTHSDDE